MKTILMCVGAFHSIFFVLGLLDFLHYRVYIGTVDKVIVPKVEYEELKAFKDKHK